MRTTRRIGLAPLSVNAVAALAEGSGIDVAELYRLTNGNPFFVTDVVRSGMRTVPASARDAVLAPVAPLGDAARETLEVAALMAVADRLASWARGAGHFHRPGLVARGAADPPADAAAGHQVGAGGRAGGDARAPAGPDAA